jgi:hypothetical protein
MSLRQFAEITAFAGMLFVAPAAYYYGRPALIKAQNAVYAKLFTISDEQYLQAKEAQAESLRKEREAIKLAREAAEKVELSAEASQALPKDD